MNDDHILKGYFESYMQARLIDELHQLIRKEEQINETVTQSRLVYEQIKRISRKKKEIQRLLIPC